MEEFKNALLILLSGYESKYSAEKIKPSEKIEYFIHVQNFLHEFEESAKSLADDFFTVQHFSDEQKKEALRYLDTVIDKFSSNV